LKDVEMKRLITILAAALGAVGLAGEASAQWTGCGAGVHGGVMAGQLDAGGPIGIGSQGQTAGVSVNCDYRMQAFVVGGFVEYSWIFGDLETVGVEKDMTVGSRLGVLVNPSSLLYTHAGWTRLDLGGGGDVDGWKIGLGNEFRIPNSPMYLDLRYTYANYDISDMAPPGFDASAHSVRLGLNVKFGPGMFGQRGQMFTTEDDPPAPRNTDKKLSAPVK
jgi:opacity protein-like surface antigen